MKVTVCFGAVRIVVPCGNGDLMVKDLINEATRRYRKATGKRAMFDIPPKCPALANKLTKGIFGWRHTYNVAAKHDGITHAYIQKSYSLTIPKHKSSPCLLSHKEPDSWVAVHHLQTQSGILDPDDFVGDVADDREQILASFEDSGPDPGVPQGGGDGASGTSSVGTGSPDIFRDPTNSDTAKGVTVTATPHIEVTSTMAGPMQGLGLQVRRSSDPNLLASLKAENGNKRWSAAAPHCAGDLTERMSIEKTVNCLPPQWEEEDDGQVESAAATPAQQPFVRSGRLSMQFLGDGLGYKWMEAAEKLQQPTQQQPAPAHNQAYTTKSLPRESKRKEPLGQAYESIREKDGEMLLIINEYGSPLGLTAIPHIERGGGLLVQHVEPGSRAEQGRLRRGDRILEINGMKLAGLTEDKVQEHLRRSLEASELRMRVMRATTQQQGEKSRRRDSNVAKMVAAEERHSSTVESKVATVSPTRKPQAPPAGTTLQVANTRKLGRKIEIALRKGANGLGFSVTTRDNPAGGHCPIYIKNILPRGAAIEDGRLRPGDRLLEVDGITMTGKTQSDVVALLRATQPGATVRIVVSRQQELSDFDEREIGNGADISSPPKPPAPVLPFEAHGQQSHSESHYAGVHKSQSARSLAEHQHQQQQQQKQTKLTNESQHFIDAGSESAASSDSLQAGIAWRSREVLTLHIPVHDSEKAGLGVSVKGKTSSNGSAAAAHNISSNSLSSATVKHDGDLGIFIKNVIHGGAASRDGRLRMNDQLMSVNGVSLLGQNNAEAMETLRRAMLNNTGKHPGMITLSVARKITRSASSSDIIDQSSANDSSNTSENSGATVIYLSPAKQRIEHGEAPGSSNNKYSEINRWSNPVLDRLTGGTCGASAGGQQAQYATAVGNSSRAPQNMRNESYYMATHDTWSPMLHAQHMPKHSYNNAVLIEDDPDVPMSPILPSHPNESICTQSSTTSTPGGGHFDATYSSQLSLETNNSGMDHFSRDALGRRSISEKHHAALDARETGTYQRNKRLREERERERRIQLTKSAIYSGSMESLTTRIANANAQIPGYKHAKTASGIEARGQAHTLQGEALDQVTDLGPSLGMKKSSSLESLQTMVQEIQMSDETRGPSALRAPRGRGREDSLRAAVVGDADVVGKSRKHWLIEEADADGGFSHRNGPFQSSLNDGKLKSRAKKPSILRGIGHMFRFGKNRKDGVAPSEASQARAAPATSSDHGRGVQHIPAAALSALERERPAKLLPPAYQPPPPLVAPPAVGRAAVSSAHYDADNGGHIGVAHLNHSASASSGGIHQNDIFNHRYQHYANYDELHQQSHQPHQISTESAAKDALSESTIECMRQQVIKQRIKVEAESRRQQHYHSQRSARSQDIHMQPHPSYASCIRPASSYYEYETVQHNVSGSGSLNHTVTVNGGGGAGQQEHQQQSALPQWKIAALKGFSPVSLNSSARSRGGPFVTQVTIREPTNSPNVAQQQQPIYQSVQKQQAAPQASKV